MMRRRMLEALISELPDWIQAEIVTVPENGQTLTINHSFGVVPTDAWLISLNEDMNANRTFLFADVMINSMNSRENANGPYVGIMRNYGLGAAGVSAFSNNNTLSYMTSSQVIFGKINAYQTGFVQGQEYLCLIFNRILPT